MCGEHPAADDKNTPVSGSSPHVRGTHEIRERQSQITGIIPACAGNTPVRRAVGRAGRDHPRMCGEHRAPVFCSPVFGGSSPHVRGTPRAHLHVHGVYGIIPACAGNTDFAIFHSFMVTDHPRMCGEHPPIIGHGKAERGSSPHVRGTHVRRNREVWQPGIIPACAGNTMTLPPCCM